MTKIKICGITNLEDARLSAKFGADALGFNFYEKSPRYIQPDRAREICAELPAEILKVGVFVNETLSKIIEIAEFVALDAVQLHGDESPEFVRDLKENFSGETIKAFRVSENFRAEDVLKYNADAILLDAYSKHEYGGTGETFDWEMAKKVQKIFPKMYLAGGLSQDNLANAIHEVKPFAVDACSCLEIEKGRKHKVNLINFICIASFSNSVLQKVDGLLFLLRLFRSRPKLYLPQKSITQICIFIYGFLSALDIEKTAYDSAEAFLKKLDRHERIQRGMFAHGIYSYAKHFLDKCNGDEEKAFDLFFAKLEESLLEK